MQRARRSRPVPALKSTRRPDIQGLRAVAVLAVVLNHAVGWPTGGFVGVDVFFVLSGFLMTSVLYREFERTGTIRFLAFYRRRIRRLLPAATLALVATVAGSYLLFGSGRFLSTTWDALCAFFFVANWRFVAEQSDYFAQGGLASPLQHFWSLSVEEQFYVVWPLTLLSIGVLFVRRRRPRLWATAGVLLLTAGGFALALQVTAADAGAAYFDTFARVWELSFGGALALAMPLFARLRPEARAVAMAAGLAAIVVACAVTSPGPAFPAPAALIAVLGSGLVIAADFNPERGRRWLPLSNPGAAFLGDISYSLYLWHFPALILLADLAKGIDGLAHPWTEVLAIAAAGALAVATYRWVEEPVRRSAWLEPREGGARIGRSGRSGHGGRSGPAAGRRLVLAVSGAALATVLLASVALAYDRLGSPTEGAVSATSAAATPNTAANASGDASPDAGTTEQTATSAVTAALAEALKATSWPTLTPDPGDPLNEEKPAGNIVKCSTAGGFALEACTWGASTAPKTAVIVGDSIAAAYLPALVKIFGADEWRVVSGAMYACPFVDLRLGTTAAIADACAQRRQQEVETITALKPQLVIVANTYERNVDSATGKPATVAAWNAGFDRMLAKIDGAHSRLLALAPPPYDAAIGECYTPRTSPAGCVSAVSASGYASAMRAVATVAEAHGGSLIEAVDWFCVDGRCPAFAGNALIKRDKAHPTLTYVLQLVPAMRERLMGELARA